MKKAFLGYVVLIMSSLSSAQIPEAATNLLSVTVNGIPVVIPAVGLFLFLILAVVVVLFRDKVPFIDSEMNPEERLETLTQQVENELEAGQSIEDHHASDKIDQAETAVDNGNYGKAVEIMEEIEKEIR